MALVLPVASFAQGQGDSVAANAKAVGAQQQSRAEDLTLQLGQMLGAYHGAEKASEKSGLEGKLTALAEERRQLLLQIMESDPAAAIKLALPSGLQGDLPLGVQVLLEQQAEVEGELEVLYEDYPDGTHRLRHVIKAHGERIALHFKANPPGLLSGTPTQVSGLLLDNTMAVASGEDDILMLALDGDGVDGIAPELPNTLGEQRTLVLLVNFQDDPSSQPWTHAEVEEVVFGQTSDFFLENSFGRTWLSGDVHGWYTIPVDSAGCDINVIMENANQAAVADGIDLAGYQRITYFHTQNGCGWSGVATLGGEPTTALMNGTIDARVVGHELGHTLGLFHAHGLECGDDTLGADCQNAEYADSLDIMGQRIGHFNAFNKERLGWLDTGDILTVEADGSYAIAPYAAAPGAIPKTLKILKSIDPVTGQRTWYYVEYRQAIGFDSAIETDLAFDSDNILNGVVIHSGTDSDGQSSNLLDMTPGSDLIFDWFDVALTTGQNYIDADAGITITTDWTDASGADVSVSLAPQAPVCVPSNPTLSLSPGESDWVAPGTTVSYSVTVTNHDSLDCATSTFDLSAMAPQNWTSGFSQSAVTLEPGASATTSLEVTSAPDALDDFYTVGVSAVNSVDTSYTAEGSVTYVVSTPVTKEPQPNTAPVAVDDSVIMLVESAIYIAVLANDSDADGDSLTIIAFSDGAKGTVIDNQDGTLTYTPGKRFKSSDSFTYTISDGMDTASATVSITLQEPVRGKPKK